MRILLLVFLSCLFCCQQSAKASSVEGQQIPKSEGEFEGELGGDLTLFADTATTTTTTTTAAPTRVFSSPLQIWNATDPWSSWCKKGLFPSIAASLNMELAAVIPALGPLGAMLGLSGAPSKSSAPQKIQKLYSTNVMYSTSSDADAFARADAIVSDALFGDSTNRIGDLVEAALQAFLYSLDAQSDLLSANPLSLNSSEVLFNSVRRNLDATSKPAPPSLIQVLAKPLLLLTSKTAAEFLHQLIGYGTGDEVPRSTGKMSSPVEGLKSPMVNLFSAFCSASEFGMAHEKNAEQPICALLNIITSIMACRDDAALSPNCTAAKEEDKKMWLPKKCLPTTGPLTNKNFDTETEVPEFNFKDVRADGMFDEATTKTLLDDEGFPMFFLFRSTSAAMLHYRVHFPCNVTTPTQQLIPGWDLTHTFSYFSQGSNAQSLVKRRDTPLVLMLQPTKPSESNKCQIIYTIRGTGNQFEWGIDLDTVMVPFGIEGVMVHRGFFQMVNSLWPNIHYQLENHFEANPGCAGATEIILTGHSLGGGISLVLAMQLSKFYPDVKLTLVAFGSPAVFNKRGSELLRDRVNSRNLRMDMDPVARSPCPSNVYSRGMIRCNGLLNNGLGFEMYHENPGVLEINMTEEMGDAEQFNLNDDLLKISIAPFIKSIGLGADIDITLNIPPPLQIAVSHSCAYACFLSKHCQSDPAKAWQCANCPGRIPQQRLEKRIIKPQ